jgi:hypothetical protein
MGPTADRIERGLSREIDAVENDESLNPQERARAIRDLERDARYEYDEARAQVISDDNW